MNSFSEFAVETDPCVPMTAGAQLTVRKATLPPGDDGLTFKGTFMVTPPVEGHSPYKGPKLTELALSDADAFTPCRLP